MKKCSKCKIEKPRHNFWKNVTFKDGLAYWCKQCMNKQALGKSRKYDKKYPYKYRQHRAVDNAIYHGIIVRKHRCEVCGVSPIRTEFHHVDLENRRENDLVLAELCVPCHRLVDRRKLELIGYELVEQNDLF